MTSDDDFGTQVATSSFARQPCDKAPGHLFNILYAKRVLGVDRVSACVVGTSDYFPQNHALPIDLLHFLSIISDSQSTNKEPTNERQ